jgi:hypothetical protein
VFVRMLLARVTSTGGGDKAATWRTQACQRTLPRRAKGRLCPGLDGALSALAARPMKRATRGPRH